LNSLHQQLLVFDRDVDLLHAAVSLDSPAATLGHSVSIPWPPLGIRYCSRS